jgi:hypothetical protein
MTNGDSAELRCETGTSRDLHVTQAVAQKVRTCEA